MKNFWPVEVDVQEYFPMEFLLETGDFNRDKLQEIDFQTYDVNIEKKGERYETEMETEQGYYRVHFKEIGTDIYEVTLRIDAEKPTISNLTQYLTNFRSGMTTTNKEIPFKVFCFVISSVLSFSKTYKVIAFHISSNESKKNNAYQMLIKNISNKVGWTVEDKKDSNFYEAFIINPKENPS